MENKPRASGLIIYKINNGEFLTYLQKRSKDAKRFPDSFGLFGGRAEAGENSEKALKREMKEELDFVPENCQLFKTYNEEKIIKDIFFVKVSDDFENKIKILEGEYGKWFDKNEISAEPKLMTGAKIILDEFLHSGLVK